MPETAGAVNRGSSWTSPDIPRHSLLRILCKTAASTCAGTHGAALSSAAVTWAWARSMIRAKPSSSAPRPTSKSASKSTLAALCGAGLPGGLATRTSRKKRFSFPSLVPFQKENEVNMSRANKLILLCMLLSGCPSAGSMSSAMDMSTSDDPDMGAGSPLDMGSVPVSRYRLRMQGNVGDQVWLRAERLFSSHQRGAGPVRRGID